MPVSNEIFLPVSQLYHSYSTSSDQDKFLEKNRKMIKVLTDSLWEQTVESLFSIKPRNYLDARRIINKNKHTLSLPDDLAIAESLLVVLRDYDVLIDKSYINIVEKLRPIFLVSLKRFCMNLTLHRNHNSTEHATKLRTILNKV